MRDWSPVMWQSLIYSSLININKSFHKDRHASGRFSHSHTHTTLLLSQPGTEKQKKKVGNYGGKSPRFIFREYAKSRWKDGVYVEYINPTLLYNQAFDSPLMPFLHRHKWVGVFLRVPIQIHPTFTARISPVMKSISTAGGEYYMCNVTNW